MMRVTPLLRYVGLALLLALAWLGIKGAIDQWSEALSVGQRVQTISQLAYGLLALLTIMAVLASHRLARVSQIAWLASITVAALLAPVVWGGAGWASGLAAGAAALLVGLGILWLLRRNEPRPAVLVVLGVTALIALRPLSAQRIADYSLIRESVAASRPSLPAAPPGFTAATRKTFWLEGGVVGGLITGAIGMELSGMCGDGRNCSSTGRKVLGFIIGAVPGFTIGAFLGDTIEKKDDTEDDE